MIIAITEEKGHVFPHFGRTPTIALYEVKDGKVSKEEHRDLSGIGHGALIDLLAEEKVSVLLCGGLGERAAERLEKLSITLYGGLEGSIEDVLKRYLHGELRPGGVTLCQGEGAAHQHRHAEGGR